MSLAVIATVVACHAAPRSQNPAPAFCMPAGPGQDEGPTAWQLEGAATAVFTTPSTDAITRALSGTWDMLTVTTEGVAPPESHRWQLRLLAADSVARTSCLLGPCRVDSRIVAVGAPVTEAGDAGVQQIIHDPDAPERVVARVDSRASHLTLAFGPLMFDAGTFYAVTELSDSAMTGRWTDGSMVVFEVRRGDTTTLEHLQGFFCGRRRDTAQLRE